MIKNLTATRLVTTRRLCTMVGVVLTLYTANPTISLNHRIIACLSERSDIAQYLIDHNCDLSIRDEEGNTAKENTSPAFWETLRV